MPGLERYQLIGHSAEAVRNGDCFEYGFVLGAVKRVVPSAGALTLAIAGGETLDVAGDATTVRRPGRSADGARAGIEIAEDAEKQIRP